MLTKRNQLAWRLPGRLSAQRVEEGVRRKLQCRRHRQFSTNARGSSSVDGMCNSSHDSVCNTNLRCSSDNSIGKVVARASGLKSTRQIQGRLL